MNRAKNPKEVLEILENNFFPKTAYYGIIMQSAVSYTMLGQQEVGKEFCSKCKGGCCYNKNHLHIADVLRFYYSGLTSWMPEFLPLPKGDRCKMLTDTGCSLKRVQRPLICVSFFCDMVAEKYTELYMIGKQIRAAAEALVKVWRIEQGEANKRTMANQERIIGGLRRMVLEYRCEEKSHT
jgi:Fe-S-cluster containining protein